MLQERAEEEGGGVSWNRVGGEGMRRNEGVRDNPSF